MLNLKCFHCASKMDCLKNARVNATPWQQFTLVVRRIHESGFEDSNLFANFAREREDSNPKAKDSYLCCQVKRTQNYSRLSKFGNFDDF
jgi:hypothetical protein